MKKNVKFFERVDLRRALFDTVPPRRALRCLNFFIRSVSFSAFPTSPQVHDHSRFSAQHLSSVNSPDISVPLHPGYTVLLPSSPNYLKDTRGIGVFTAGPGMGKSFALRCFSKSLNPNLYHMEYIFLSTVSVMEFYRQFCHVLGVEAKGGKPSMFDALLLGSQMDKKAIDPDTILAAVSGRNLV